MRDYLLLIILTLCVVSCGSPGSDVGGGLIHFENDFTTIIKFYDQPEDLNQPSFQVNLIYEDDSVGVVTSLKKESEIKFKPAYLRDNRSVLVLQVLGKQGQWLKVVTDKTKNQQHWIRQDDKKIETWPDFLKSVHRVRPYWPDENPLRKTPRDGEALPLSFYITCFSITDVNGDWVRVENRSDQCSGELGISNYPYAGFLRWKKDREILISFDL